MLSNIMEDKTSGKIIGFTTSSWDLLHSGHIAMLVEAKSVCDVLVVGLQSDPTIDREEKNKPVQCLFERWVQIQAVEEVDYVVPYSTEADLLNLLNVILPNKRILGDEYKGTAYTGHNIEGIDTIFNRRLHTYSTSSLRERICDER